MGTRAITDSADTDGELRSSVLNDESHLTAIRAKYYHTGCKSGEKEKSGKNALVVKCHRLVPTKNVVLNSSPISTESKSFKEGPFSKNNYQYFSDSEVPAMAAYSVGDHISMKNSFSMSSLPPSNCVRLGPPQVVTNARAIPHRLYNSLTNRFRKNRKVSYQESWRLSLGPEDVKDELWVSFHANYQHMMDNTLIDSCCNEAKKDLNFYASSDWTYDRFLEKFSELECWLGDLQNAGSFKDDNTISRKLKSYNVEEMQRRHFQRKNFVEQSSHLIAQHPELKDEILLLVSKLNTKWDEVAGHFTSSNVVGPKGKDRINVRIDLKSEIRGLRSWIRNMERKLGPINFRISWSLNSILKKSQEHKAFQKDVESYNKTVSSLVKICERLTAAAGAENGKNGVLQDQRSKEAASFLKATKYWQRQWQLLYLRCLEWQCYIDDWIAKLESETLEEDCFDSEDEQPAPKQRKLNYLESLGKNADDVSNVDFLKEQMQMLPLSDDVEMSETNGGGGVGVDGANSLQISPLVTESQISPLVTESEKGCNHKSLNEGTLGKMLILPETALFNRSDRARNYAVIYCKHVDTDSEIEPRMAESPYSKASSTEDSSEEGWTYIPGKVEDIPSTPVKNSISYPSKVEMASIRKLVEEVDELVQQQPCKKGAHGRRRSKGGIIKQGCKIREWLKDCEAGDVGVGSAQLMDSCDASGEYTTEEEEYDRRSSCDQTLVAASQDNGIDASPTREPKAISRRKSGCKTPRPFSTSELTALSPGGNMARQFSVSESALNSLNNSGCGTFASPAMIRERVRDSMNSLRRRKIRHRKRSNAGRKGHSESADNLSGAVAFFRNSRFASFSEASQCWLRASSSTERAIVSDPPVGHRNTSDTDPDVGMECGLKRLHNARKKLRVLPAFRLGPTLGVVTNRPLPNLESGLISGEEPLSSFSEHAPSSFSEQAWDNYQEKYMSEAYSEDLDLDQAKKLTDFGDDYRKYLQDNHSDFPFSLAKSFFINAFVTDSESSILDSDSDLEDVKHFMQYSTDLLHNTEGLFNTQSMKPSGYQLTEADFADIRATCAENARCLRILLRKIEKDCPSLSSQKVFDINGILEKWEGLEGKTDDMEQKSKLQKEIREMRKRLNAIVDDLSSISYDVQNKEQLQIYIQNVKEELEHLKERKEIVTNLNVQVHKLVNESYLMPALRDDMKELYDILYKTSQRLNQQLMKLEQAYSTWRDFDLHMEELQCALRGDQKTLNMLDVTLQTDVFTPDVATTVRNMAKVLSKKQGFPFKDTVAMPYCNMNHDAIANEGNRELKLGPAFSVEGSFSDSGISDSGSEHDLSEREKRLATLKKLARHLEAILAPGSAAITNIKQKIDEAEEELRELQQTCRNLIVKTSLSAASKMRNTNAPANNFSTLTEESEKETRTFSSASGSSAEAEKSSAGNGKSKLWRVIKAALPFHIAIVVLLCIACFLEPNCCDAINNLNLSFSPQLHYMSGPPPT